MGMQYRNPPTTPSSIGDQLTLFKIDRQAMIDAAELRTFSPLANVRNMPSNMGQKIKVYHYVPLLDDRNVNDQGIDANGVTIENGNLYGSSRDIGTVNGKLPLIGETGGRKNRVGFTRLDLEGTMFNMGIFFEFSEDSLQFDTDTELMMHLRREAIEGAHKIYENKLQIDLINSAGVVFYAGSASSNATMNATSLVTFADLQRLNLELRNNRTPLQTTYIFGSRLTDTRVVSNGYVAYCSNDLQPHLMSMLNFVGKPAWIPTEAYGDASTIMVNEIGTVAGFRFISPEDMLKWEGAGSAIGGSERPFRETDGKYDIYPILVVGRESFSTIGFFTKGTNQKFRIMTKMPGMDTMGYHDPYGKMGITSIQWWYGFMPERTERLAVLKTVCPF